MSSLLFVALEESIEFDGHFTAKRHSVKKERNLRF